MALGPAGPLDHLPGGLTRRREFPGRGRVRPPPRPLLLPPRRSRRCQYRPTATAQSLWELLSYDLRPLSATHRLHLPIWMPVATLLYCSSMIPSRVFHMPIGSDNNRMSRRATPRGVTSPSAGRRPCQLTFVVLPFAQPTAFTAGCGLARRSVSSHGTTGSVFWRQAMFVPHARSGSAVTVIRCSPREHTFGTGATMACGGLKKISASTTEDGVSLAQILDDPGPFKLPLFPARYTTSAGAVRGSWCLQVHVASAFSRGGPT